MVGSSRREGQGGRTYRALSIAVHPDYVNELDGFFPMRADIAVVRTLTRIRFGALVQPIALESNLVPTGSELLMLGWGRLSDVSFIKEFYLKVVKQISKF